MQFTNRLNIPEALCEAVKNDPYDAGDVDITVTQLIRPPQQVALQKYHRENIIEDVSDRIYALMGQAMHTILQRSSVSGFVEKRMYAEVNGWIVGGTFDALVIANQENNTESEYILQDYKQMSIWEAKYGLKPDKTEQLNLLHYLINNGTRKLWLSDKITKPNISKLEIIGIFRDWSKPQARRDKTYPQHQVEKFPIEMWSSSQQEKFIKERVEAHQQAQFLIDKKHIKKLPQCTDDERWASDKQYALKKEGRKSAVKTENTSEKLWEWAKEKGLVDEGIHDRELKKGYSVEVRPGESKRCIDYCNVSAFCNQFSGPNLRGF